MFPFRLGVLGGWGMELGCGQGMPHCIDPFVPITVHPHMALTQQTVTSKHHQPLQVQQQEQFAKNRKHQVCGRSKRRLEGGVV